MMKNALLAGSALAFLSTAAVAADLAVKAPPSVLPQSWNWTGFYIGAQAGWEFGAFDPGVASNDPTVVALVNPGVLGPNSNGGAGGAHAGFDYQTGGVVWGVRTDWNISGLQGSVTDPVSQTTITHSITWHGDAVVTLGYLVTPQTKLYGLGGVAFGEIKDGANSAALALLAGSTFAAQTDNVHVGWTAGVGIEHYFTPVLKGGIEWDYINLGDHGMTLAGPGAAPVVFNINDKAAFNSIMARLSWKLF